MPDAAPNDPLAEVRRARETLLDFLTNQADYLKAKQRVEITARTAPSQIRPGTASALALQGRAKDDPQASEKAQNAYNAAVDLEAEIRDHVNKSWLRVRRLLGVAGVRTVSTPLTHDARDAVNQALGFYDEWIQTGIRPGDDPIGREFDKAEQVMPVPDDLPPLRVDSTTLVPVRATAPGAGGPPQPVPVRDRVNDATDSRHLAAKVMFCAGFALALCVAGCAAWTLLGLHELVRTALTRTDEQVKALGGPDAIWKYFVADVVGRIGLIALAGYTATALLSRADYASLPIPDFIKLKGQLARWGWGRRVDAVDIAERVAERVEKAIEGADIAKRS